jgi:hypothetical protein
MIRAGEFVDVLWGVDEGRRGEYREGLGMFFLGGEWLSSLKKNKFLFYEAC